eukprot:362562-Chlamydomonas_euryale.AAC.4
MLVDVDKTTALEGCAGRLGRFFKSAPAAACCCLLGVHIGLTVGTFYFTRPHHRHPTPLGLDAAPSLSFVWRATASLNNAGTSSAGACNRRTRPAATPPNAALLLSPPSAPAPARRSLPRASRRPARRGISVKSNHWRFCSSTTRAGRSLLLDDRKGRATSARARHQQRSETSRAITSARSAVDKGAAAS